MTDADIQALVQRIAGSGDTQEPFAQALARAVSSLSSAIASLPGAPPPAEPSQPLYGPWQSCSYPPGCSGTLFARSVGDPVEATIEITGQASSTSMWDGSYSFILAYMPPGLVPSTDRFALVPSSHTPGTPDSISGVWFKPTGEIAIAFIYEKGQNPLIAWFDAVAIQV